MMNVGKYSIHGASGLVSNVEAVTLSIQPYPWQIPSCINRHIVNDDWGVLHHLPYLDSMQPFSARIPKKMMAFNGMYFYPKNQWTLQKRGVWMCFLQGYGISKPPGT